MKNNKKNGKDEIVDNKIERSAWLSECEQMVNMEIKSGS